MKEQELVKIKNKTIQTQANLIALQHTVENLQRIYVGLHEVMKKLDGYDKALEEFKETMSQDSGKTDGTNNKSDD